MELFDALVPLLIVGVLFIIIGLPIVALVKAFSLGGQVESLRKEVERLNEIIRERPTESPQRQPEPQPKAPEPRVSQPEVFVTPRPVEVEHHTVVQPPPVAPPPPPTEDQPVVPLIERLRPTRASDPYSYTGGQMEPEPQPSAAPQPKSRTLAEWEMLIGGNIVNRLAALAMVIVAAFFLKYAYDKHWITPPILVCIGFAAGLALLLGGSKFHRSGAEVFAQGLLGAGISILYLSGYATFRYELVSQPIALAIMSVVTAVAIVQALRYDSLVVCLLGLAGGFLTPLLLSGGGGGSANHFGLFAYMALLDIGLLAVAQKKDSWAAIDPLVLIATWLTFVVWSGQFYTPALFGTAFGFLTVVWLLFCFADICRIARGISTYTNLRAVIGVCSSLFFYIAAYLLIQDRFGRPDEMKRWMALVSLSIGAVYFLSLLGLLRSRAEDRGFIGRYALTAISLLAIATGIQFEGFVRVAMWAVETLGLVWAGLRWSARSAIGAGLALSAIAVVALLVEQSEALPFGMAGTHEVAFWNLRFLAYATVAAVSGLIAYLFSGSDIDERNAVRSVYESACYLLIGISLAVETNALFEPLILQAHGKAACLLDYSRYVAIYGVWATYGLVLSAIGIARKSMLPQCFGLGAIALGTLGMAGAGLNTGYRGAFTPLLNVRALGFGVLFVVILLAKQLFAKRAEAGHWTAALAEIFRAAISLLAFELITVETWQFLGTYAATAPDYARETLIYLGLGSVWAIYSLPVVWLGLKRNAKSLVAIGLGVLGLAVMTVALRGAAFDPIGRYVPICNTRCAAFGILLFGLLAQYRMIASRRDELDWASGFVGALRVVVSMLILELMTAETWQLFDCVAARHAVASMGIATELIKRLLLGVVWVLYSLPAVWYGLKARSQPIAVIGLCALGAGVLTIATRGFGFEPVGSFRLIANMRFAAFAFAVVGLLAQYRLLVRNTEVFPWTRGLLGVLQVIISLLIFELATAETRDLFAKKPSLSSANMRGMMLSVVWLVYSFLLISFGFWKRAQTIRLVAISLFGITILKVFFSDLSFLQQPYRMFSFAGLALILFATSYLYQRFRGVILNIEEALPEEHE